jgi:quercetin dioxygenase-like cupin family protein
MAQSSFLNGKVLQQSLPQVRLPTGADAPTLKRLQLPQGELAQIHDAEEAIHYMAIIELRAGTVRGNHYHKVKKEFVYVIEGEVLLVVEDIELLGRAECRLRAGDLAVIQTGIAHALCVTKPGQAIEFSPARFDPGDIYRHPVATEPAGKG